MHNFTIWRVYILKIYILRLNFVDSVPEEFLPVDWILDLVFEPDGQEERVMRGGRGGGAGELHCSSHQPGHLLHLTETVTGHHQLDVQQPHQQHDHLHITSLQSFEMSN